MKNYIVYEKVSGLIRRHGNCPDRDFPFQAKDPGQAVMEGRANDLTQKIVGGKVVDKTPQEIEAEKPPVIKDEDQPALITNADWQKIQDRIAELEKQ